MDGRTREEVPSPLSRDLFLKEPRGHPGSHSWGLSVVRRGSASESPFTLEDGGGPSSVGDNVNRKLSGR